MWQKDRASRAINLTCGFPRPKVEIRLLVRLATTPDIRVKKVCLNNAGSMSLCDPPRQLTDGLWMTYPVSGSRRGLDLHILEGIFKYVRTQTRCICTRHGCVSGSRPERSGAGKRRCSCSFQ